MLEMVSDFAAQLPSDCLLLSSGEVLQKDIRRCAKGYYCIKPSSLELPAIHLSEVRLSSVTEAVCWNGQNAGADMRAHQPFVSQGKKVSSHVQQCHFSHWSFIVWEIAFISSWTGYVHLSAYVVILKWINNYVFLNLVQFSFLRV